jgi:hypothetical protein
MPATRYILMAAALLIGATAAANAQYPYPYTQPPQTAYAYPFLPPVAVQPYVPTTPPHWSYNPYTSGLGPCPQRGPGDEPCSEMISPSYGQPSYWPQ